MYISYCMHATAIFFFKISVTNKIFDIKIRILGEAAHAHKYVSENTDTQ